MINNFFSEPEQWNAIKCLYDSILAISKQQKDLLEQGTEESWDMDLLIELMNQRQAIIERIDELGSFKTDQQLSGGEQHNQPGIEPIKQIIGLIQTTDRSCQDKLEVAMQKISSKLSQTRENKKAQLAYDLGDVDNSAWFFDKKQ